MTKSENRVAMTGLMACELLSVLFFMIYTVK